MRNNNKNLAPSETVTPDFVELTDEQLESCCGGWWSAQGYFEKSNGITYAKFPWRTVTLGSLGSK